jgi:hypothetical protein
MNGARTPCKLRPASASPRLNPKGEALVFLFKLEHPDGTAADPTTLRVAVPNWSPSDTIAVGHRSLRVVDVRDDDPDQPPALVVEDVSE